MRKIASVFLWCSKVPAGALLRSRYENASPNLCWVFCALLRLHFRRRRHTFASLWGACLRFASLWRANSCGDSCVLGVHLSKICCGLIFCLRKTFIFQKFAVKFYFGLSLHIFQHGSPPSLENVCDSWCMHQTGFSSAAVVPQGKLTKLCSSAAVVSQSKSTELCQWLGSRCATK